jgi:hypothetical protein
MENNDSIELQSNSKRARIEVNLANLPTEHCLKKKKLITILVVETTFKEHIYKKRLLVNIFNYFLFNFSNFFIH